MLWTEALPRVKNIYLITFFLRVCNVLESARPCGCGRGGGRRESHQSQKLSFFWGSWSKKRETYRMLLNKNRKGEIFLPQITLIANRIFKDQFLCQVQYKITFVSGALMLGVFLSLFLMCSLIHKLGRPLQNVAFVFSVPLVFLSLLPFPFFSLLEFSLLFDP